MAILTASQVPRGRALYDQAQAAIARWQAELPPPRKSSPSTTNSQTNNALPRQ